MKEIKLVDGPKNKGFVALVDDEDFEYLSQFRWYAHCTAFVTYAVRSVYIGKRALRGTPGYKADKIPMHRDVMKPGAGELVDHIDMDGLNNQRSNLRICTKSQNQANRLHRPPNSSGFVGVTLLDTARPGYARYTGKPFKAHIQHQNKRMGLGHYATAEEAAVERDLAALFYHGEFARLNFPERIDEYRAVNYQPRQHRTRGSA